MATARLSDSELASRAVDTFRSYGYEGTSLNRLAEAAGLEKASLYYRFPGGKDQIVMAAAAHVAAWFNENVFVPLSGNGSPRQRVQNVARLLRKFYGDGTKPCVLDTLSLQGGPPELQIALRAALDGWLAAFTGIAIESGMSRAQAVRRAEEALTSIEGSLILARVLSQNRLFLRTLATLPRLLTEP
jgi:AcrR family transcriptional regulator